MIDIGILLFFDAPFWFLECLQDNVVVAAFCVIWEITNKSYVLFSAKDLESRSSVRIQCLRGIGRVVKDMAVSYTEDYT